MPSRGVLQCTAVIAILAVLVQTAIRGSAPDTLAEWLAPIAPAVALAAAGLWVFDRFAWRWPGILRLTGRPLLHGTWHGSLASGWVNPETGQRIEPDHDVFLVIRQCFWSVTVRQLTRESASHSIRADLVCGQDRVHQLVYLYSNTPKAEFRKRSEIHYGAAVLTAPQDGRDGIEGHYFTDRDTKGDMTFRKRYKKLVQTHQGGRELVAVEG